MNKHLILLGAPGSGKGTQSAKLISQNYNHVSTGNLLRKEIEKKSELGLRVKEVMDAGQLVSDDLVMDLLKMNLDLSGTSYIFDGYPRNVEQAKTLDDILDPSDYVAVYFELDAELLIDRIKNRRMTKDGKHIYNLKTNPPKIGGICDVTGEELVHRSDDQEDIVRDRMDVFKNAISPMIEFFESKGKLASINANQDPEKVFKEINDIR